MTIKRGVPGCVWPLICTLVLVAVTPSPQADGSPPDDGDSLTNATTAGGRRPPRFHLAWDDYLGRLVKANLHPETWTSTISMTERRELHEVLAAAGLPPAGLAVIAVDEAWDVASCSLNKPYERGLVELADEARSVRILLVLGEVHQALWLVTRARAFCGEREVYPSRDVLRNLVEHCATLDDPTRK